LLKNSGKQPLDLSDAEGDALIESFKSALEADQLMCVEVARNFYNLGFAAASSASVSEEPEADEFELHSHPKK